MNGRRAKLLRRLAGLNYMLIKWVCPFVFGYFLGLLAQSLYVLYF